MAAVIARHDWAGPVAKILRGLWTDAYVVGWLSAGSLLAHHGITKADPVATVSIGVDWQGWSPGDTDAAKQILGRDDALGHLLALVDTGDTVADRIVVSRMDRLAGVLIDGLEQGLAPASIARQLTPILADKQWAHLVALTETTRAVSEATLASYARNGVEAKEWMTAEDQRVCAQCAGDEDQGAIPLDGTFPSGNDAPPGHPLCRCSIAPAFLTPAEAAAELGTTQPALVSDEEMAALTSRAARGIEEDVAPSTTARAAGGQLVVRDALAQAKTLDEVQAAARAEATRFGVRGAGFMFNSNPDWSVETFREHVEGILRVLERYPDSGFDSIIPLRGDPGDSFFARTGFTRTMNFHPDYVKPGDRAEYLERITRSRDARWFTPGADNPIAIALHEMGHVLDYETYSGAEAKIVRMVYSDAKKLGISADTYVRREISAYAATSNGELIGEAFADVMIRGEAASPLSLNIVKLMDDEYVSQGKRLIGSAIEPPQTFASAPLKDLKARALAAGLEVPVGATRAQIAEMLYEPEQAQFTITRLAFARGDALARLEVALDANPTELRAAVDAIDQKKANLATADITALRKAADDPAKFRATLDRITSKYQITPLQRVGDLVPYDPRTMSFVSNRRPAEGDMVRVVKRGTQITRNGETVRVSSPEVKPVSKAELERIRRAQQAAPSTAAPTDLSRMTVAQLRAEAAARGVTIPSGTRKQGILDLLQGARELRPGVTVGQAAARQAEIDTARNVAEVASRTYESVANGASERALRNIVEGLGKQYGVDVSALLAQVDNPAALLDAVDAMAARANLTRAAVPGERAAYNRDQHKLIGQGPSGGQVVEVVRPGYTVRLASGEEVGVAKTMVEAVQPSEPVSAVLPTRTAVAPDLSRMSVTQLRAEAKTRGLTGYSKLTKPQLLERLAQESGPDNLTRVR